MSKILIVEDEKSIRRFIHINLKRHGFHVSETDNGEEALKIVNREKDIDVVLLDVMLPGIDGFEVCDKIREFNEHIGIIMLTAKVQESDHITGLLSGADDYINKPFSPKALIARIQSLLRRLNVASRGINVEVQNMNPPLIELFPKTNKIKKSGDLIDLTQTEFQLLKILMGNKEPISRNDLLDVIWGLDYVGDAKIVDVNIRRLRKKIEDDPSQPTFIKTIWGYGYQWTGDE
ncbi:response regulator transcription factor [Chengkuizengella axinellae]|uniref:Response regulator transcription factor n=1 Tax=Chengkuizengella axinellae TaxID=3064388 RepID=A0ABT9ITM9_9BACL|nr:response regulator transcription factor [Chengkuizengella sp. 2205SS18-9]MDP5272709.1 response regulator transcription factor [Chengkuizengella sp. 2205SS18-9]